jgi:(R,R)-butanediol dehydrogenase / meso-butanediol dehydrogenase / diacetyl reductase
VRAVRVAEDRRLVAFDSVVDEPGPGEALLDVAYCGICGSDLHFRELPELFPAGTVPGHEFSARVAAVGDGVSGWTVGDRVCVLPFAQCGECEVCLAGEEQVCPQAVARGVGLGTGRPGGYAERVVVDERMLFALPESVDDRAGALVEPLAVAIRAVDLAEPGEQDLALVVGAGPIGLLTALVLRNRGVRRTVVCSRNAARARRAAALGFEVRSPDELSREPLAPACVVDCAGSPSSAQLGVELLAPRGRLLLVGLSLAPLQLSAPPIVIKEVEIRGVLTYNRRQFQSAIELLALGVIPVEALITNVVPLSEAEAAFQALSAPGSDQLKILLAPSAATC